MKIKTYIYACLAAMISFTACSRDDDVAQEPNTKPSYKWNGEILMLLDNNIRTNFSGAKTRASWDHDKKVALDDTFHLWVRDAAAPVVASPSVIDIYKNVRAVSTGVLGTVTNAYSFYNYTAMMYYPMTGNAVNIYALHINPLNDNNQIQSGIGTAAMNTFYHRVDTDQTNYKNYCNSDALYGDTIYKERNADTAIIRCNHILTKIIVIIDDPSFTDITECKILNVETTAQINMTPSNSVAFNGSATGRCYASVPALTSLSKLDTIEITHANDAAGNEGIIVPQTIAAGVDFLQFKTDAGGFFKYTMPTSKVFEANKKYIFHVSFAQTRLNVTVTVMDWSAMETINWY